MAISASPRNGAFDHRPRVVPPYQPPSFLPDPGPATIPIRPPEGSAHIRRVKPPAGLLFRGEAFEVEGPDGSASTVAVGPLIGTVCTCPDFERDWQCKHVALVELLGLDQPGGEGGA